MEALTAAILLAAGRSSRMGRCKPLLPLGERPFIVHCLDAMISAGIRIIVVVAGENEQVVEAVAGFPVSLALNPDPQSDMSGSVRTGLRNLSPGAAAVMVALADHPLVSPETYRSLLQRHREEPSCILIPVHQGRKGHPTLFPLPLLRKVESLPTLRDVVHAHPASVRFVPVPDKGVILDIDTPEDYRLLTEGCMLHRTDW